MTKRSPIPAPDLAGRLASVLNDDLAADFPRLGRGEHLAALNRVRGHRRAP